MYLCLLLCGDVQVHPGQIHHSFHALYVAEEYGPTVRLLIAVMAVMSGLTYNAVTNTAWKFQLSFIINAAGKIKN